METVESEQLFGRQLMKKLLLPVVLGVLAYSALLLYGDVSGVMHGLRALPAGTILAGAGLSLASFALRAIRWHYYLGVMNIRVPLGDSALVFTSGLGMSITPGKVGELLKSLLLKESYDVPVARSAPVVIAERVADLSALLALGGAGLFWGYGPLAAALVACFVFVVFYALGRSTKPVLALIGALSRVRRFAGYRDKLLTAHASLYELWGGTAYVTGALLSLAAWGLQALIVVVLAAGVPPAGVSLPHALVAYSAPLLAGTLALLPGGLVLTEASMTGVLQGLSQVSAAAAATLTISVRVVTFWLAVAIGFLALAVWQARRRRLAAVVVEKPASASRAS